MIAQSSLFSHRFHRRQVGIDTYKMVVVLADSKDLSSFMQPLLHPNLLKSPEIPGTFEVIAVQGHPRSSILVPIAIAYATSSESLIVTLNVSPTVSRY